MQAPTSLCVGKSTTMDKLFEQLQDDTRSFWQSPSAGVRRLDRMPSPSDFFRDYVATGTPVVISGGASACLKASRDAWDDLASLAGRGGSGDQKVTVDFTPNGRGDCVVDVPRNMLRRRSTSGDVNSNASGGTAGGGVSAKLEEEDSSSRGATGTMVDPGRVDVSKPAPVAAPDATVSAGAGTTAVFVKPEERRMEFKTFIGLLEEGGSGVPCSSGTDGGGGEGVPYLSHQVCIPAHSYYKTFALGPG